MTLPVNLVCMQKCNKDAELYRKSIGPPRIPGNCVFKYPRVFPEIFSFVPGISESPFADNSKKKK